MEIVDCGQRRKLKAGGNTVLEHVQDVAAGSMCLMMPETQGKPLADTFDDLHKLGDDNRRDTDASGSAETMRVEAAAGNEARFVLTEDETTSLDPL
jgi:hypothetical protein